ncbi:MAG: hypothetical protein AB7U43_09900 [Desulfobacter sp.]
MKNLSPTKIITVTISGFCFAMMCLLLALSYIPELSPKAYNNFRRSGLIKVVPMMAGVGLLSSVTWLWLEHKEDGKNKDDN